MHNFLSQNMKSLGFFMTQDQICSKIKLSIYDSFDIIWSETQKSTFGHLPQCQILGVNKVGLEPGSFLVPSANSRPREPQHIGCIEVFWEFAWKTKKCFFDAKPGWNFFFFWPRRESIRPNIFRNRKDCCKSARPTTNMFLKNSSDLNLWSKLS